MSSGQYCDDCAEHYFNCSCKSKNIKDGAESITGNAVEKLKEHFGVDTGINIDKKIEESLHKADKDIQEGLRKQYLEQLTRLNGDLS